LTDLDIGDLVLLKAVDLQVHGLSDQLFLSMEPLQLLLRL
jgi:hypothetical protein